MKNRSIELSVSEDDYARALKAHALGQYTSRRPLIVLGVTLCILVLFFGMKMAGGPTVEGLEWPILAVASVVVIMPLLLIFVLVPWNARRVYKQQKALHRPMRIEWSQAGFTTSREDGRWTTPWSDFMLMVAGKDTLLLYIAPNLFNLIPTRALSSEQLADLKSFAALIDKSRQVS